MFHSPHQKEGGPAAQTLPPHRTQDDSLPLDLREHVHGLRLIHPVIGVSVMTLQRQNAELDSEIASVLSQHACDRLDCDIARLESILTSRTWRRRQQEVHV